MAKRVKKAEQKRKSKRATSKERKASELYSRNDAILEDWKAGVKPGDLAKRHEISLSRIKMIVGTALMKEWKAEREG